MTDTIKFDPSMIQQRRYPQSLNDDPEHDVTVAFTAEERAAEKELDERSRVREEEWLEGAEDRLAQATHQYDSEWTAAQQLIKESEERSRREAQQALATAELRATLEQELIARRQREKEEAEEAARLEYEELERWRQEDEAERERARAEQEEAARWEQEELKREEERLAREASDHQALSVFLVFSGFKADAGTDDLPVNAKKRVGLMGSTYPLHCAVKQGDAKMVELLLAYGADAAQQDSSGKTPLALAERQSRFRDAPCDVVQVLRDHLAQ